MALTDEDKAWFAGRLDAIEVRLDKVDGRLDKMDGRFDRIDDRLIATNDRLDASTNRLSNYILEMRSEVSRHLDSLDQRLDFMANALLNVQPLSKAMVELGSLMGGLTKGQQHSTDRHFDLETRVARLEEQMSKLTPAA
jgi:hypothetical protein